MKRFAALYQRLDGTTSTNAKVAAMVDYFQDVEAAVEASHPGPRADGAWAVHFLSGGKLKRLVGTGPLRLWAREEAGLPEWLFDESYHSVGDLAETVSLVLDAAGRTRPEGEESAEDLPLARWVEERLLPLKKLDEDEQRRRVTSWWRELDRREVFLLAKLLTGALRVGVSRGLVERALAEASGLPKPAIAHRLMGRWTPSAHSFAALLAPEDGSEDESRPYPFYLASPLDLPDGGPAALEQPLGPAGDWVAEWKWDGIRSQLVRRGGEVYLWSRGEELITERFPEIAEAARSLPDGTVVDGEVLAFRDGAPLPFALLQKRIGRKSLTDKVLAQAPAALMAYDLLEHGGDDWRDRPLEERRRRLAALLAEAAEETAARGVFHLSEQVRAASWGGLAELRSGSRERGVEGLMLKRLGSPYRSGRKRGDWWKWKVDPYAIDAVLLYAQPGHGRRANLLTDYTFAVWADGDTLVPIAKAYSGLDDAEIRRLDRWLRRHTRERFGPVRSVEPEQVFELHFEGIRPSSRHKSGVALRFPRMARWRTDKLPADADTLEDVRRLLP
jgi:DNA ligase-1